MRNHRALNAKDADGGSAGSREESEAARASHSVPVGQFYSRRRRRDDDAGWPTAPAAKRFGRVAAALEAIADADLGVIGLLPDDEDDCGGGEPEDDEIVGYKPTPQLPRSRSFLAETVKPTALAIKSVAYSEVYDTPESPGRHGCDDQPCFAIRRKPNRLSSHEGHFSTLADELVLAVFRFLPHHTLARCARVCRRWMRLAFDEDLWKRVNLSGRNLAGGVVGTVLSRGAQYVSLAKAEVHTPLFTSDQVPQWYGGSSSGSATRLLYLDVSMASISVDGLAQLLSHCRMLHKLSLEGCPVSDEVCRSIGKNARLTTLNLSQCDGLTSAGLVAICEGCPLLASLNVAWTQLSHEAITRLVHSLPAGLVQLNLSGSRERLTDNDVMQLVKTCPHISELDLSDSTHIGPDSVHHLVRYLQGLQHLSMSRCYRVDASTLSTLQELSTLRSLSIFGTFPQQALMQIQQSLRGVVLNSNLFSTIARPTVGMCRTSIWNERVRELTW